MDEMTNGERVLALLAPKVDVVIERPWGSNAGDPWIKSSHALYGLPPNPWCAMGLGYALQQSGAPENFYRYLIHPYTGFICSRCDASADVRRLSSRDRWPAGTIVIKCGTHVELVERDLGNGTVQCIGQNVNQGVRRTVRRKTDWRGYLHAWISEGTSENTVKVVYSFEDLKLKPKKHGPWRVKAWRERVISRLPEETQQRVRRIRSGRGINVRYSFEIIPEGSPKWQFGPWDSKEDRDRVMKAREKKTGRRMRPFAQRVAVETKVSDMAGMKPSVTTGDTTT